MSRDATTFVIGAGASAELNDFTDGVGLAAKIGPMVAFDYDFQGITRGDPSIWRAIEHFEARRRVRNLDRYLEVGKRIARGMPQAPSIDSYMASNAADKDIELVGKLAIAKSILMAEAACGMTAKRAALGLDFGTLANTWFGRFWHRIADGCVVDDLANKLSACTLIVFNYDRCAEHFLYHAIQNYYTVASDKAAEILQSLTIYHPYGTVGRLPWQRGDGPAVKFGQQDPGPSLLIELVEKSIKTITEQIATPSDDVTAIRAAIQAAHTIVFLGFSFQPQNMRILRSDSLRIDKDYGANFYATAWGMSDSDQNVVKNDLQALRPPIRGIDHNVYNVGNLKCRDLFDSYRKSLELR